MSSARGASITIPLLPDNYDFYENTPLDYYILIRDAEGGGVHEQQIFCLIFYRPLFITFKFVLKSKQWLWEIAAFSVFILTFLNPS